MDTKLRVIHSDPEILGGTPVFFGTRVPVKTLLDYLEAAGIIIRDNETVRLAASNEKQKPMEKPDPHPNSGEAPAGTPEAKGEDEA